MAIGILIPINKPALSIIGLFGMLVNSAEKQIRKYIIFSSATPTTIFIKIATTSESGRYSR